MSMEMFLKLDGVQGDSKSLRHFNEIVVTGWSWGGAAQEKALATSTQQGQLQNSAGDFNITKGQDKASQILFEACMSQRTFAKGLFSSDMVSAEGSLQYSYRCAFKNLKVTAYQSGINGNGASEGVSFEFEEIEITNNSL